MFGRSRRNLAHWFTLSMGSILLIFASIIYYQQAVERLQESDRLMVMAIAVPLTLGVVSLVGWWLGGLAMQPIRHTYDRLQRFTSDASHELRAPLATILSNAQVGLMSPVESGQPKHVRLEKIAETAKSMNRLTMDLLFLARQSGRLDSNSIRSIHLNNLLKETISTPSIQSDAQHLTLQLKLPEENILIKGNPDLLTQAIVNLLTNACKYTLPEGTVWVRLVSQYHRILIQVEDTGIGSGLFNGFRPRSFDDFSHHDAGHDDRFCIRNSSYYRLVT